jgi:hypothetical protein
MPPMAMKGLPSIFVPADESGVTPPLVPLMSKTAQGNLGTRPPMMMNPRVGAAITGRADGLQPGAAKAAKKPQVRRDIVMFVAVFLLIAGVAGAGLMYYLNPWGAKAAVNTVKAKLDAAAELPGQAVDKAQNAVAAAREKEQAKLDAAAVGDEAPGAHATNSVSATPGHTAENPAKHSSNSGLNGSVTNELQQMNRVDLTRATPTSPEPSQRFVKWGSALKITGVFQGSPSRALIEGRLIREGEVIEPIMGVVFSGVDATNKQVILQDETGAQVRLKY